MNFSDNCNRFPEKWRSKLFDAHSDLGYPNSYILKFFGVELEKKIAEFKLKLNLGEKTDYKSQKKRED